MPAKRIEGIVAGASVFAPLVLLSGKHLLTKLHEHLIIILDLTIYEACNTYWKMCLKLRRISMETALKATAATSRIARLCKVYRVSDLDLEEVEKIALDTGMTFYDSSHLALARMLKTKIATEDEDLLKWAPRYGVKAISFDEFVKMLNLEPSLEGESRKGG